MYLFAAGLLRDIVGVKPLLRHDKRMSLDLSAYLMRQRKEERGAGLWRVGYGGWVVVRRVGVAVTTAPWPD